MKKYIVFAFVVFIAVGVWYTVGGNGGNTSEQAAVVSLLSPAAFAEFIGNGNVVVIDVHTPEQAHISDDDLFIPQNDIATSPLLPEDKNTRIAVYCRSGNMSAIAAADLVAMGYTHVADLDGGKNAWDEFFSI